MESNHQYSLEELLTNESFLDFYFKKDEEHILDWEEWRDQSPSNAALIEQACDLLDRIALRWPSTYIQNHWQEFRQEIQSEMTVEKKPMARYAWLGWAAAIIIIIGVGVLSWYSTSENVPLTLVNNHSDRLMIYKLPDSTRIQLKPHSRITVAHDFGKVNRNLNLIGEAVFEVAKDPTRPFRVFSGDLTITALGTTFNIKAFEGAEEATVVLTTGKIKVENNLAPNNADILNPGEEITFKTKEKRLLPKRKVIKPAPVPKTEISSALQLGSWIQFNQTPFEDVATSLEYNFGIQFSGVYVNLRDLLVTYRFKGDRSLEQILKDLSLHCHFEYEIKGKTVFIKEGKNAFSQPAE